MEKVKNYILIPLLLSLFPIIIFSFIQALQSTSQEFILNQERIYLNWTNNYTANLTVSSAFNIILVFNNSTQLSANYSQGMGINLIVKNDTGDFSNTNTINTSVKNFTRFTLIANVSEALPGRYKGNFFVFNSTNSSENASVEVILDSQIELSSWLGKFNGTMPSNSTEYHSFYFLPLPNTTSITVNLTFDKGDLDLFLLANNILLAKSINKDNNEEKLSYSFINPNLTYEIRIYGNNTSNVSYNGTVVLNSLNSSLEKIYFGTQNVSNQTLTRKFTLTNIGNISIEDVKENYEIYYLKRFSGSGSANFTFFLPNASFFEKIKVRLVWNGTGSYNFSVFRSNQEVCNSSKKHLNAIVSNVEKEEFVEIDNTETSNWWRVEVKNESVNISPYSLIIQAFVNSSNWISTNFSSYENKSFDVWGSGNESKTIEINLTIPKNAVSGEYKGFLIYSSEKSGELKIPLEFNLINRLNITIVEIKESVVDVTTQTSFVNVTLLMTYFDGENVYRQNFYTLPQNMSFELYEPNASYKLKINFTDISNNNDWKFNLTIPRRLSGGRYYILINLSSEFYVGESLEDPSKQLTVNDTGLFMSASYPSSLRNGTTGVVNVSIKNFGPVNAVDAKIKLINQSLITNIRFLSTNCQRKSVGEEVTFNISAFNSTGCYVAWEITASKEGGTAILWINGTSGNWFRNLSLNIEITEYYESAVTTTTTIPNITISTTTTTTILPTLTTTTIPNITVMKESFIIPLITPESPIILNITRIDVFNILKITIFVNKNVSNVNITLMEATKPQEIIKPIPEEKGSVFKYLEIFASNLRKEDIVGINIDFQVEKSWITQNNIDPSKIFLYRYHNNSWEKLPTRKTEETANFFFYRSLSSSFSLFAIVGEKSKAFPIWLIFVIVGIIVGVLVFLFWPVEEKPVAEKKEVGKKEWEELKKKWEELKKKIK